MQGPYNLNIVLGWLALAFKVKFNWIVKVSLLPVSSPELKRNY